DARGLRDGRGRSWLLDFVRTRRLRRSGSALRRLDESCRQLQDVDSLRRFQTLRAPEDRDADRSGPKRMWLRSRMGLFTPSGGSPGLSLAPKGRGAQTKHPPILLRSFASLRMTGASRHPERSEGPPPKSPLMLK